MSPYRLRPLIAALVLALALAGCSGAGAATSPSAAAGQGDGAAPASASAAPSITPAATVTAACPLLTQKEAEAIVGTTLSAGVEGLESDPSCTYDPDPKAAQTAQVRVLAGPGAEKTYGVDKDLDHPFADVAGIGDEAHQEELAIFFRKGTTWAGITLVYLDDSSKVKQQLQDAAKVVVSRLP